MIAADILREGQEVEIGIKIGDHIEELEAVIEELNIKDKTITFSFEKNILEHINRGDKIVVHLTLKEEVYTFESEVLEIKKNGKEFFKISIPLKVKHIHYENLYLADININVTYKYQQKQYSGMAIGINEEKISFMADNNMRIDEDIILSFELPKRPGFGFIEAKIIEKEIVVKSSKIESYEYTARFIDILEEYRVEIEKYMDERKK